MTIIYKDGGKLKCDTIEVYDREIFVDGYITISIDEIDYITSDEE